MRDPDEWTWDEDGNPEYVGRPREEPDCGGCNDGRSVPAGVLNRVLLRRPWVPCPSCNPTAFIRLYQRSQLWRIRGAVWRLFHPRAAAAVVSDEAPF